ncbi:hypothetical protein ACWDSJ_02790 [Nocardia sp. NPDC003482]
MDERSAVPITGTWTIESVTADALVHLILRRALPAGRRFLGETDIPLAALAGLSLDQLLAPDAPARFRILRDAGVLAFDGQVGQGRGRGEFAFTAAAEPATPEDLFTLAIHDIGRDFVGAFDDLGYDDATVADLVELRLHAVTPAFVRQLRDLGYERIPLPQLVELRAHGVTPKFIRHLRDLGYANVPADQLVELRVHGLSSLR